MLAPCEKYFTVLVIRGFANDEIRQRLNLLKYPPVPLDEIMDKREELKLTLPKEVLKQSRLREVFEKKLKKCTKVLPPLDMQEAVPVLHGKRVEEWEHCVYINMDFKVMVAVRSLILAGAKAIDIALAVNGAYGTCFTEKSIAVYEKYFWNVHMLSRAERFYFISQVDVRKHKETYLKAFYRDKKELDKAIFGIQNVSYVDILNDVMTKAYGQFNEAIDAGDYEKVLSALRWADLAIKAGEKFTRESIKSDSDVLRDLESVIRAHKQSDIPNEEDLDDVV